MSGFDLSDRLRAHAEKFGLEITNQEVTGLSVDGDERVLHTPDGELRAKAVILCPGASPQKLGVPGEDQFGGRGVSYCGTCDGPFYRDQVIAAIGGGNTAVEEAMHLTHFAEKVYLIHRRDELRADKVLADRVLANPKIEVLWSHVPLEFLGDDKGINAIKLKDLKADAEKEVPVTGIFVFVGTRPNTEFLAGSVEMDQWGFIVVDKKQGTSIPGVFAAGDCVSNVLKQIVVAAGEGAVAAYAAQHYLENLK